MAGVRLEHLRVVAVVKAAPALAKVVKLVVARQAVVGVIHSEEVAAAIGSRRRQRRGRNKRFPGSPFLISVS